MIKVELAWCRLSEEFSCSMANQFVDGSLSKAHFMGAAHICLGL
jgi:hypothetical protein